MLEYLSISLDLGPPESFLFNADQPNLDVKNVVDIHLPRLCSLTVASSGDMPLTPLRILIRALRTTSLRSLDLCLWRNEHNFSFLSPWLEERQAFQRGLANFLHRCNLTCTLYHLSVTAAWLSCAGFLTLLPYLNSLQHLTFARFIGSDRIIEALTLPKPDSDGLRPRLCPTLRQIDLTARDSLSEDALVNLALSRSTNTNTNYEDLPRPALPSTRLEELNITCNHSCLLDFLDHPLVTLSVADGLRVCITRHSDTRPPHQAAAPSAMNKADFRRRTR